MIKIIRATKESRPRDKKRKRFILVLDDSAERSVKYHLTEREVAQFRKVLA